ncbi:hypothetical protein CONCODRAFT_4953 [Conidiobolus coronatus NRRL 28638]|uniref:G-protein coupled receptors family 1 profile domain-containing protein n=1 Tax=Conidiobolus coronatus (strain ATCC 28846 / CBS 209.66 / NRRL 28638) TaxID=796925 RepID=A0A137PB09_CONC2|nr:hypothetical protein CONCODRAFT_4953 [Conidiobolus coronatus NRRL 28638]|eukprot:KXN72208.1 hypothetical protein CONCODRAFT_4953 [Conidiobolus coronatus NRRL 28638]
MNYYEIRKTAYPYNYVVSISAIPITLSGMVLSILVLSLILRKSWKSLNIDLKLICFTLIFDMLECFLVLTSAICNLVGFADYLNSMFSCTLNAVITIFTVVTSINLVGVVAIESFQLINLISCVVSGAFGGFSINSTSVYCLFNLTKWSGLVGNIFLTLSIGSSIGMIYFSYIGIMIKRRNITLQTQQIFPLKAKKIRKNANSTIFKSTLIILASTFTTLPYCVLLFISLINPQFLTPLVGTLCTWSIMFNMIINTIIVLRLRTDLWIEFKVLILIKSDISENDSELENDHNLTVFDEGNNEQLVQK